MKKKLIASVILILILGGTALAWNLLPGAGRTGDLLTAEATLQPGPSGPTPQTGPAAAEDSPRAMSVQGLEISHGEEGKVLWTLKAREAQMAEEGGLIRASDPFLTYFMHPVDPKAPRPPQDTIVTVKSVTGDLNQQTQDMRFIRKVVVANEEKTMLADLLTYSGAERNLTSEGRTLFNSPNMDGEADKVIWDLNTDMLYASGQVVVNWETVSK